MICRLPFFSGIGLLLLLMAAMNPCAAETKSPPKAAQHGGTYVFICPDKTEHVVRANQTEAWIFRPGGSLRLSATPGTDSNYSNNELSLRIVGDKAWINAAGKPPQICENDRRRAIWEKAKLDGVDFRAVGNEPPWIMEIQHQARIVLITGYDALREEFPLPPAMEDRASRTTRWNAGGLVIEITVRPCHDSMSGEAFESQVTITRAGTILRGCGRPLH